MGDLVQFVPRPRKSRPSERLRMIAEARANYQAIFPDSPPADDTAPAEMNPE